MKPLLLIALIVSVLRVTYGYAQGDSTRPLNPVSVTGSWIPCDHAGRPYFRSRGVSWPCGWPEFRGTFGNVLFSLSPFTASHRSGILFLSQYVKFTPADPFSVRPPRLFLYPPSDSLNLFEKPGLEWKPSDELKSKDAYHLKIYF
jgi:hypothetical protein